jgi:phosphoenolpyruvate carboxykinase (GTP)
MADHFAHWLKVGEREGAVLPKIFLVNWFRKNDDGTFIWPGFGENSRVLEWVFRRCNGEGETVESSIGLLPREGELNLEGLDVAPDDQHKLLNVDDELVREQLPQVKEHLARFGDRLPDGIRRQLGALEQRLS